MVEEKGGRKGRKEGVGNREDEGSRASGTQWKFSSFSIQPRSRPLSIKLIIISNVQWYFQFSFFPAHSRIRVPKSLKSGVAKWLVLGNETYWYQDRQRHEMSASVSHPGGSLEEPVCDCPQCWPPPQWQTGVHSVEPPQTCAPITM